MPFTRRCFICNFARSFCSFVNLAINATRSASVNGSVFYAMKETMHMELILLDSTFRWEILFRGMKWMQWKSCCQSTKRLSVRYSPRPLAGVHLMKNVDATLLWPYHYHWSNVAVYFRCCGMHFRAFLSLLRNLGFPNRLRSNWKKENFTFALWMVCDVFSTKWSNNCVWIGRLISFVMQSFLFIILQFFILFKMIVTFPPIKPLMRQAKNNHWIKKITYRSTIDWSCISKRVCSAQTCSIIAFNSVSRARFSASLLWSITASTSSPLDWTNRISNRFGRFETDWLDIFGAQNNDSN